MGGIFGFFLGVSMVSVVHSVQKFYDRVMTRLGINMLLILHWKILKEPSRMIFIASPVESLKHSQSLQAIASWKAPSWNCIPNRDSR